MRDSPNGTSSSYTQGTLYDCYPPDPGTSYLRIAAEDTLGNTAAWSTLFTIRYDDDWPSNPASATSSSHTTGSWSSDNTVDMSWTAGTDGSGSGIAGYSIAWSLDAPSIPDHVLDTSGLSTTSPALADGAWYFSLRSVDQAGNWSTDLLFNGPYWIDANPPGVPQTIDPGCSAQDNTWQNTCGDPNFLWGYTSSEGGAEIAGFYYYWGTSSSGTSTNWTVSSGYNPPPVSSSSTTYLRLQAKDSLGKTSAWATVFSLRYDATVPNFPTSITSSSHTFSVFSADTTVDASWLGATDSGSGIAGYSIEWSKLDNILPDTVQDTTGTTTSSPPLADGCHYLYVRVVDNAGNWGSMAKKSPRYCVNSNAAGKPGLYLHRPGCADLVGGQHDLCELEHQYRFRWRWEWDRRLLVGMERLTLHVAGRHPGHQRNFDDQRGPVGWRQLVPAHPDGG